jgi:glycosyltransferase involved in cell wall biosynthesis
VVKALTFVIPGELSTRTGGYVYDRRIIEELRKLGWHVDVVSLGDGFPQPTAEQRDVAHARLRAIPNGRCVVADGLAYGVLPDAAEELCRTHAVVALVHHPLALETGVSELDAARLRYSERAALGCASHVIVTSAATKRLLVADYGVAAERITIVLPGTDASVSSKSNNDGQVRLLAVGALVPRKGYDVLLAALATLLDLSWTLSIAGDRTRDPACSTQLAADVARFSLAGRVHTLGAVSDAHLAELYQHADVFVLPSRFEGYGMAFAEALAHGLPVIGTTAGAIPDTVPHGAGILVPPDDVAALAAALRRLIENPSERKSMAEQARAATSALPRWTESAKLFAQVLESAL